MKDNIEEFIKAIGDMWEMPSYQRELMKVMMRMKDPIVIGPNRQGRLMLVDKGEYDE